LKIKDRHRICGRSFLFPEACSGFYADFFGLCVKSCGIVIAVGNKGLKIALL